MISMPNKTVHHKCAHCGTDFGKYPNKAATDAHYNEHPECISEYSNGMTGVRGLQPPSRPIQFYWVDDGEDVTC